MRAQGEAEIAIEQGETRYEGVTWTTPRQLASSQLIPLPQPARRGLINLADDVIATNNHAVAAAAQLHPNHVEAATRSGHAAHRGRSAETLQIARPHDPAPGGTTQMNCIEPVPSGSSTSPIRPSLPGIKPPQSRRALDGTALQVSAMKLPMPIRERSSIAANPQTRTG